MATNTTPARTLGQIALDAAVKAVKADDSAAFTATVALSLVMANRQVERAEADKDITDKENKRTFRAFLKYFASKGNMVWRDTDHLVSGIMSIKDKKARESAVSEYVDGGKHVTTQFAKPEGARLTEGLAKLRTWSFRLMADVCANHADAIRDIMAKKAAGASGEALQQAFTAFVKRTYGDSFAKLTARLSVDKPRKEVDAIDSICKRAENMTDSELAILMRRLAEITAKRAQADETIESVFGETPATAETMAEAA
ncbi:hypothetical protein [Bradyrhizobium sp. SZCCHNRI2010]|uniref:hypothetical protein n=1 Tax=Bradyrhizobium sp. SZCCHNRI2010 TaxID=3057283 RepID=UPI0028EBFA32|nr:hypothetical protein [Bradyrhizobium sp. SZCCHNRI2010]